jgi:hypothetical protein
MFGSFDLAIVLLQAHGEHFPEKKAIIDDLVAILRAENEKELEHFNRNYQLMVGDGPLTEEEIKDLPFGVH